MRLQDGFFFLPGEIASCDFVIGLYFHESRLMSFFPPPKARDAITNDVFFFLVRTWGVKLIDES